MTEPKFAVSNLAWPRGLDDEAFACLNRLGIQAMEVAPTRVWPDWMEATYAAGSEYRHEWLRHGIQVSSLQAIFTAKNDGLLFGDDAAQQRLLEHLEFCGGLAASLRAKAIVFGAARNRVRGRLSDEEAYERAARLLRKAAPTFAARGVTLCVEPTPPAASCDFLVNATQAASLVRRIDHPGVRLHLDTAGMFLAGDNFTEAIHANADILAHFHVSEPQFGDFSDPVIPHEDAAAALSRIGYRGWITLAMRTTPTPLASLLSAAAYLVDTYRLPHS